MGIVREAWAEADRPQRWLYAVGTLVLVAGLLHLVPAVLAPRPWEGPLGWRKPILFGFSFGLTVVTLAWLLSFVQVRGRWRAAIAVLVCVGTVAEVALTALQTWRAVPSHFNSTTGFDSAVFSAMGVSVALIATGIVVVTVVALLRPVDGPPSLVWGVRLGLLLLVASQAVGGQMIATGVAHVEAGGDIASANLFGAGGPMKVPHAVTLHAVQVLPGLAWLLARAPRPESWRLRIVLVAAGGYGALVGVSLLQTYRGRATFALDVAAGALLAAGVGLLLAAAVATIGALRPRRTPALRG